MVALAQQCTRGSPPGTQSGFPDTHWSVILTAGGAASEAADEALEHLCRDYWYPIYAFIRRRGHAPHEAQDLTQGFFAHILNQDWLNGVGPERGRFRTYVLCCLTRFLTTEWRRAQGPQRRPSGGIVPLETGEGEERYAHEPIDEASPDKIFHRHWVETLLERARSRLRAEHSAAGKLPIFEVLGPHLGGRCEYGSITGLAACLGLTEGAVRVAIHRLRGRFGELLREAVAETLVNPADVDTEIRSLFSAWG
jgi:RNA polymerase sigma-70 factor (ECF subfamily)